MSNVHCVYSHSYDGDVFYIGCGTEKRPFIKSPRSKLWREYVKNDYDYDVNILFKFGEKAHALAKEKELICAIRPACNIMHVRKNPYNDQVSNVQLSENSDSQLKELVEQRQPKTLNRVTKISVAADLINRAHKKEIKQ